MEFNLVGLDTLETTLHAIGFNHGTQHVMLFDQLVEGAFNQVVRDSNDIDLSIPVSCDVAEFKRLITSNPIGLLDIRERKAAVAI